ncbi:ThuA domain-containing protein [Paenibacillus ehimensis]|uniref:ThuA domain-containing protein n=1 Tax=Paenibacillus ehimensis TaxID=79264 RepID=UPI002DB8FE7D|nr:ThuA domain-containing protein [Paenibacillus ehimensis]MEC0212471.1 ThuA domain-containing protein [Paenibacillus ehimensis]
MKKALIVWGGWPGHQPGEIAALFRDLLTDAEFEVEVSDTLEAFADGEKLKTLDLIVPVWSMGEADPALIRNVSAAVQNGAGLAGCHGGMCDAFRTDVEWQFMTGGQWVAHPGDNGVDYEVKLIPSSNPLLDGIGDFRVRSEQYYMHVDPAVNVLAITRFPVALGPHSPNGAVDMPVVWTKWWGAGRVFYCSLGHEKGILEIPQVNEIMRRGLLWASDGRAEAARRIDP